MRKKIVGIVFGMLTIMLAGSVKVQAVDFETALALQQAASEAYNNAIAQQAAQQAAQQGKWRVSGSTPIRLTQQRCRGSDSVKSRRWR